jgi:hypothetical protein
MLPTEGEGCGERAQIHGLQINPQFLLRHFGMSSPLHPFFDENWTLGESARWVIGRTPQAVNSLSIDGGKLFEILPEIERAFLAGEVATFATTHNDPIVRELPAETWSIYRLAVEEKNGLIRILPLNPRRSNCLQLLDVRIRRNDVVRTWPPPSSTTIRTRRTTVAAENHCRRWLVAMMKSNRDQPRPKAALRAEALKKFPALSSNGFNRQWDKAIDEAVVPKWRAPGPRRHTS